MRNKAMMKKFKAISAVAAFLRRKDWQFHESPVPGRIEIHGPGYVLSRKTRMGCINAALKLELRTKEPS